MRIRLALVALFAFALTQSPAGAQSLSFTKGQNISPAYEGWEQAADGTKYFLFGYMNRNWEEEINVPVGADNSFSRRRRSGPADALSSAPQPVRVPRARARSLHREGRNDLDADDVRED